jgi:hypothetical protein
MGLPMQQVVKEFANASNGLKAHGANMQKVFIDLQNQSKNVGIEFGRLQDITRQFDTFEGAADAAGKLNAILGGDYLNSIQLLNADEAERVRILQDSLKASGQSFEAMSKQERMAAAQAIGIDDVTELQKLMNNSVQEGTVEALNKAQADKELKKSAENLGTMQEKLNNIMGQFAVALIPVLDAIKPVLTQISEFMSKNPQLIEGIAKTILVLGGLHVAFSSAKAFAAMKTAVTEAGGVIPAYIKSLTQKTVAEQTAAGASKAAADVDEDDFFSDFT